jgi:anti-anti-sigma factor
MQITRNTHDSYIILELNGRLDGSSADTLAEAIEAAIQDGNHQIRLDCQAVDFISSVGIRTLLRFYKQLKSVGGQLALSAASSVVHEVIKLAGLAEFLLDNARDNIDRLNAALRSAAPRQLGNFEFNVHAMSDIPVVMHAVGDPQKLGSVQDELRPVMLPRHTHAVGLGCLTDPTSDDASRLGEVIATDGIAIAWHTNGDVRPDDVVLTGDLVPTVTFHSGLIVNGEYGTMATLEPLPDAPHATPLSDVVINLMDLTDSDAVAFTLLVEVNGIVGAAIRRSPAILTADPFAFPAVRDNVMFTTERATSREVALISGVASRRCCGPVNIYMRPLSQENTMGHIHAAVFPYRPVPKGMLAIHPTVNEILQADRPTAVFHCIVDDREFDGIGETEVIRGAVWVSPVAVDESTVGGARR